MSFVSWFVLCDQKGKDSRQEHENERLHDTYKQFHEIERNRNQPAEHRDNVRHPLQNTIASINVSEQSKAERDRTEQDRNNFEPSDHEEVHHHYDLQRPGRLAFRAKNVKEESADPVGLNRPHQPEEKENRGH